MEGREDKVESRVDDEVGVFDDDDGAPREGDEDVDGSERKGDDEAPEKKKHPRCGKGGKVYQVMAALKKHESE